MSKARKPNAVDRTVSIFTGKADMESSRARDGKVSNPGSRQRDPYRLYEWISVKNGWVFIRETPNYDHVAARIVGDGAGWVPEICNASGPPSRLTKCSDIHSARVAVDRELYRRFDRSSP